MSYLGPGRMTACDKSARRVRGSSVFHTHASLLMASVNVAERTLIILGTVPMFSYTAASCWRVEFAVMLRM